MTDTTKPTTYTPWGKTDYAAMELLDRQQSEKIAGCIERGTGYLFADMNPAEERRFMEEYGQAHTSADGKVCPSNVVKMMRELAETREELEQLRAKNERLEEELEQAQGSRIRSMMLSGGPAAAGSLPSGSTMGVTRSVTLDQSHMLDAQEASRLTPAEVALLIEAAEGTDDPRETVELVFNVFPRQPFLLQFLKNLHRGDAKLASGGDMTALELKQQGKIDELNSELAAVNTQATNNKAALDDVQDESNPDSLAGKLKKAEAALAAEQAKAKTGAGVIDRKKVEQEFQKVNDAAYASGYGRGAVREAVNGFWEAVLPRTTT